MREHNFKESGFTFLMKKIFLFVYLLKKMSKRRTRHNIVFVYVKERKNVLSLVQLRETVTTTLYFLSWRNRRVGFHDPPHPPT